MKIKMISWNMFQSVTLSRYQAFENVKSSKETSETFYTNEQESCGDEINKYTIAAEIMTQL